MITERHEELACLQALDLLDRGEAREFAAELDRREELQTLVRDLRRTSAALAHLAPPVAPPPDLKARVLASVAARTSSAAVIPAPRSVFLTWIPWGAAAALAVAAAWLAQLHLAGRSEAELLRTQTELATLALESARQQAEAERILRRQQVAGLEQAVDEARKQLAESRTQLAGRDRENAQLAADLKAQADLARLKITALASLLTDSPKALAIAVWDPRRQEGVLKVEKLPPLNPHQDYQLWVVDPQYPNPVDGGVFTVDAGTGEARYTFKARQSVGSVSAFAVTLERKGGVPKAEGPFVLLGK